MRNQKGRGTCGRLGHETTFSHEGGTAKEMLPVFAAGKDGGLCLKPMVQQIFEQLFDFGIREFFFIVGKGRGLSRTTSLPTASIFAA